MEKKAKDKTPAEPGKDKVNRTTKDAPRRFARSRKGDDQPQAAERALDSAERSELEKEELVGERHQ
jgi:hypothetical protein